MTELTVIIPLLHTTRTELFEGTLASVLECRPPSTDVLVVNADGYTDSYQIEEEGVRFVTAPSDTSLIGAINLGIAASDSLFVHPICCGGTVEEGWAERPLARFDEPDIAAVVPVALESFADGEDSSAARFSAGLIYHRSGGILPLDTQTQITPWCRLSPIPAGAFFRRQPLLDLGLLETRFASSETAYLDLTLLLDGLGFRTVFESTARLHFPVGFLPRPSEVSSPVPRGGETAQVSEEELPVFDRFARLTAEEELFGRWSDWGGGRGRRIHGLRLFAESILAFLSGELRRVREARHAGRHPEMIAQRREKLQNARRILIERLKAEQ